MFKWKHLDVITLFHKPGVAASTRVHSLLKQASAAASATTTEDQASNSGPSTPSQPFELNITEDPPTPDQLKSILEYVGAQKAGTIIKGAKDTADAMRKLKESGDNFQRPVTVDWNNGHAVAGDNESEIMKMLSSLPKQ